MSQPRTVPWDDATVLELKLFAVQALGMSPHHSIGEIKLREQIRKAFPGNVITITDIEPEPEAPADAPVDAGEFTSKALRGTSASRDPKVRVTIAEVEGAGGRRPVFAGVNGVAMLIPRGRPVDIPYRYYLNLMNAVKTMHEQDEETGDILSTDTLSYPMSVNIMPPQAEIDAFHAADA